MNNQADVKLTLYPVETVVAAATRFAREETQDFLRSVAQLETQERLRREVWWRRPFVSLDPADISAAVHASPKYEALRTVHRLKRLPVFLTLLTASNAMAANETDIPVSDNIAQLLKLI